MKKIKELKYELNDSKSTVTPLEPSCYQNVIPLFNNDGVLKVSKPFSDGLQITVEGEKVKEEAEKEIDMFHSNKGPVYHFVDWANTHVIKGFQNPIPHYGMATPVDVKAKKEKKENKVVEAVMEEEKEEVKERKEIKTESEDDEKEEKKKEKKEKKEPKEKKEHHHHKHHEHHHHHKKEKSD